MAASLRRLLTLSLIIIYFSLAQFTCHSSYREKSIFVLFLRTRQRGRDAQPPIAQRSSAVPAASKGCRVALLPGLVEEVVYRFAFLGLTWMLLRHSMPGSAGWLAGLLALFAHNFMHFDDLWLQAPWTTLGMGLVMAMVWGLPPTILARRRDLESAVAFHWIQDVARFLAGS